MKEHGGDITARNRPEGGAIIEVRLPSAGRTPSPEKSLPAPRHELAIQGRILLVEDEEAVLEFERDVLTGAMVRQLYDVDADVQFHQRAGHLTVVPVSRIRGPVSYHTAPPS